MPHFTHMITIFNRTTPARLPQDSHEEKFIQFFFYELYHVGINFHLDSTSHYKISDLWYNQIRDFGIIEGGELARDA